MEWVQSQIKVPRDKMVLLEVKILLDMQMEQESFLLIKMNNKIQVVEDLGQEI
jgi:hypothetical protein